MPDSRMNKNKPAIYSILPKHSKMIGIKNKQKIYINIYSQY